MWFRNWYSVLRIVLVGPSAYMALVLMLRISGKRTLSKFNAFDLVITVALGSTFATVLLSKDVALLDGIVALATLIALQFAATWLSVRWALAGRLIKSEPRLLFHDGEFLHAALKRERVTQGEVLAAVREQGIGSLADVQAVIIETAGTISVMQRSPHAPTALQKVRGMPDTTHREPEKDS